MNDHALNGTGSVSVARLEAGAAHEWDAYVRGAPGATFFHLAGWREIVEDVCGHRAHYLAARRGGRIVGVLPLAQQRSLLFGNAEPGTRGASRGTRGTSSGTRR